MKNIYAEHGHIAIAHMFLVYILVLYESETLQLNVIHGFPLRRLC